MTYPFPVCIQALSVTSLSNVQPLQLTHGPIPQTTHSPEVLRPSISQGACGILSLCFDFHAFGRVGYLLW